MASTMSNKQNTATQANPRDVHGDLNLAAAKILEAVGHCADGHPRMTMDDARAIASVLREYYFSVGLSGSRDQISTTKPEINPV